MQHYHPTNLRPMLGIIARVVIEDPDIIKDPDAFVEEVARRIPGFNKKERCLNCGASMAEYTFTFDILDAILLLQMARKVRGSVGCGVPFTEANKVRVQQQPTISYAVKSRTTQCAKLGLIAKLKGRDGKQIPGTWVITTRGFEALRGERVPKSVRVFREKIMDRPEETITLSEVLSNHIEKVRGLVAKGKHAGHDWKEEMSVYNKEDWVHIAGMHQGSLI